MDLRGWNERYLSGGRLRDDPDAAPTPLLMETARHLPAGKALDLACGAGRNALWLAQEGWQVTAVDGAPAAIGILRRRAAARRLHLDARVADLEAGAYQIEPAAWDLILMCYYLQRDLFERAKAGVVHGGIVLAIVHIAEPGEKATPTRLRAGELAGYFKGWEILHSFEGKPGDASHQRPAAEIVARRIEGD